MKNSSKRTEIRDGAMSGCYELFISLFLIQRFDRRGWQVNSAKFTCMEEVWHLNLLLASDPVFTENICVVYGCS